MRQFCENGQNTESPVSQIVIQVHSDSNEASLLSHALHNLYKNTRVKPHLHPQTLTRYQSYQLEETQREDIKK